MLDHRLQLQKLANCEQHFPPKGPFTLSDSDAVSDEFPFNSIENIGIPFTLSLAIAMRKNWSILFAKDFAKEFAKDWLGIR